MGEVDRAKRRLSRRRFLTGIVVAAASLAVGVVAIVTRSADERSEHQRQTQAEQTAEQVSEPAQRQEALRASEWGTIGYPTGTSYTDHDVIPGATYEYRVASVTGDRQSDWSAAASATTETDTS